MHYGLDIGPGAIGPPPTPATARRSTRSRRSWYRSTGDLEAAGPSGASSTVGWTERRTRSAPPLERSPTPMSPRTRNRVAVRGRRPRDGDCGGRADRAERAPRRRDGRCHGRAPLLHDAGFARRRGGTDRRTPRGRRVSAGRSRGRRPRSAKGFAVVYDQLAANNYTGLGICLESQTTSAALAYYGVPAMAVTIAKGREWIVERAAGETGHAPAQVAGVLEEFVLDPTRRRAISRTRLREPTTRSSPN